MEIDIVHIADRPDLAALAAGWMWGEWGQAEGRTPEQLTAWLAGHTARAGVNQAFVLLDGGIPAGTATLEADDLDPRPDLTPWLANVFVDPAFRSRGHAVRLVRHVEQAARRSGIGRLYLHTATAAGLYARLGWATIGQAVHHGHEVTIMARDLG